MTIKIESYASVLVAAVVVWYLARRTNLGSAFTKDVMSTPARITGYFGSSRTTTNRPLRVTDTYRRPYTRAFQSR